MKTKKPKVCFMRPYNALNRNLNGPGFCMPTMNFGYRSIDSLRGIHALSGNNVGNFIHTESMSRVLDYDPDYSSVLDLNGAVRARNVERVAEVVNERFDLLVFSCANLIRPKVQMGPEMAVFRKLKIPMVIVGAGIQEELPDGFAQLEDTMVSFLEFANSSAKVFGVRGELTAEFLAAQGLKNAEPLGCPSFYGMPHAIDAVAFEPSGELSAMSAGHIRSRKGPGHRFQKIADLLGRIPNLGSVSYTLQNELFFNPQEMDSLPALDQASHRIDDAWISEKFFQGQRPENDKFGFYYFGDTSAWRQHGSTHDFYLGDRIHGGVINLQASKPAIFVHNDARVKELAAKLGVKSLSLEELETVEGSQIIDEYLSVDAIAAMKKTYRTNARIFLSRLEQEDVALSADHRAFLEAYPG